MLFNKVDMVSTTTERRKEMRKELGKIRSASFGHGGYQECEIGLWLTLGGPSWGVSTSISGGWSMRMERNERTKWSEQDRLDKFAKMTKEISELLIKAKVDDVNDLVDLPIEAEFDGNVLKSWRVLTEVL